MEKNIIKEEKANTEINYVGKKKNVNFWYVERKKKNF